MFESTATARATKKSLAEPDAPLRWVCLALGLAIIALALRIASTW
ncbi:hypothetical protein BRAS3843_230069 [Bradyrhizobium sp. STM 3843]|nr:hypothetical protein [Bradyrhizobium sp. STM 3843]CCE07668.1 hypothetical protein BRAS3843_230069 [Bradyrhizobium sp. STM 3843]